ncbi:MAG: FHA domain-containing protein [Xanthobacteraceae bacterium]|nr:FHA domain-containing protein [Xanthobacteraceae bacterium]QYK44329.1 MAG: FHA domain-containing protein [Xanthobacteraceae bacterium]
MDDFVDVEMIKDGQRTHGRHKLPLKIGRGNGNTIRIGHEPNDQTISRLHTVVDLSGGHLQITDKSTNGTNFNGRIMKTGETQALADGGTFEVRGHQFRVSRVQRDPNAPVVFYVVAEGGGNEKAFPIGESLLLVIKSGDRIRFEEAPFSEDTNYTDIIARQRLDGEQLLGMIFKGGKLGVLRAAAEPAARININNHLDVRGGSHELRPLDVVNFGGVSVDIMLPDMKASRCHNHTCRLLNPYDPHGNCRWCGHRLTESETRFVLKKKR